MVRASAPTPRRAMAAPVAALALLLCSLAVVEGVMIPVDVTCSHVGIDVELCEMDRAPYIADPPAMPMFKEQVGKLCSHRTSMTIHDLKRKLDADGVPPPQPAGFIFHMTRCGSTLVANMLGSVSKVAMYTESSPPAALLRGCSLSEDARIDALRTVVRAMGQPTGGKNVVFKFQSILNEENHLIRKAFPATPWVFIYRKVDEVMSSNLYKHGTMSRSAPCLRSQGRPPMPIVSLLNMGADAARRAPREQYCAAHLAHLMTLGADNIGRSSAPARSVSYEDLPTAVVDVIAPMFRIRLSAPERARVLEVGAIYSKSRNRGDVQFESDSAVKHQQAASSTAAVFADMYGSGPYRRLAALDHHPAVGETKHTTAPVAPNEQLSPMPTDDDNAYPVYYPLGTILDWWNPDDSDVPDDYQRYDSLARFDYQNVEDRTKALQFRKAELPFVIYNMPSLNKVKGRWTNDYLDSMLTSKFGVESSHDNHFMYYNKGMARRKSGPSDWERPTKEMFMTFKEWVTKADKRPLANDDPHYYFRASSGSRRTKFISDELKYFNHETKEGKLFIVDPSHQRGIHCRFGMKGIIAESHYDGGRNFVSMVRGHKRYIVQPPSQCKHLKMLPYPHPSARHSSVDWSDRYTPYMRHTNKDNTADEAFDRAASINVVLGAGEAMYIPSFWFHYIISLDTNIQCNTRSGTPSVDVAQINECGFRVSADQEVDVARSTRRTFRDAFAEFNDAAPSAQFSRTGLTGSVVDDDAKGTGTGAGATSPSRIANGNNDEHGATGRGAGAATGRKPVAAVGSSLLTPDARGEVERARDTPTYTSMWILTGVLGVGALGTVGIVLARWQRAHYLRHGGSI